MCTWDTPDGALDMVDGEIHLWQADLAAGRETLPTLEQTLSAAELAKADRFRFEVDRDRYIFAHGAVRAILARYLDTTASELVFRSGPQGKPEVASGTLRFNMSHSHELVLCAISRTGDLGVDVERLRPGVEKGLCWCFSPSALRSLDGLAPSARRRALFQGWTRMEAYWKAHGEGLGSGRQAFDAFLDPGDSVFLPRPGGLEQPGSCWLHDLSPQRGYVGALAARGERWEKCRLRYWKWQAGDKGDLTRFDGSRIQPLRVSTL